MNSLRLSQVKIQTFVSCIGRDTFDPPGSRSLPGRSQQVQMVQVTVVKLPYKNVENLQLHHQKTWDKMYKMCEILGKIGKITNLQRLWLKLGQPINPGICLTYNLRWPISIPASDLDTCWMASCSCFLTSGVCSSNTSLSACSYSNALAMVKASPQLFLWLQPRFKRMSHLELHTALETEGWTPKIIDSSQKNVGKSSRRQLPSSVSGVVTAALGDGCTHPKKNACWL